MALGAAGGSRIPSSLVAVISRVIDQSFTLDEAMKLPRVHPTAAHIEIENIPRDDSFPSHFTDKIISMDDSLFLILGRMTRASSPDLEMVQVILDGCTL